jgi:hypothetical protein
LATLACGPQGITLIDLVEGLDLKTLSKLIDLPIMHVALSIK